MQLSNDSQRYYNKAERNPHSTSDEIIFEVFHCVKTGRDYSVINVDGERYLVDFGNPGIGQKILFSIWGWGWC